MFVPYLTHGVLPHEARLIHMSLNAVDTTVLCVLPHSVVLLVHEDRRIICVTSYHERIAVYLSSKVSVVEILVCVEQRLLLYSLLHKVDELEERVAETICLITTSRLNVDHREQVLLFSLTLCKEIAELRLLVGLWAIEMIATHLQSVLLGKLYILNISRVLIVASLRTLYIDIRHLRVIADGFPEHIALIVTDVYAVNMQASVFADLLLCMHINI